MSAQSTRPEWQREMIYMTVIYRLMERGEKLHIVDIGEGHQHIEKELTEMLAKDLLQHEGEHWAPTEKGREFRDKMVAMYDQVLHFEVFAHVDLTRQLSEEEGERDEEGLILHVFDHIHDPRFEPSPNAADMRLAMLTFLSERMVSEGLIQGQIDPYRIVFLQKLADGELKSDDFWLMMRTGKFFREVQEIADSQYRWTDVSDDEEEAAWVMENIYTAGMLEQRKRDGYHCSKCDSPLAIFEAHAKADGEAFDHCFHCGADFSPPPPPPNTAEFECPNCGGDVHSGQHRCTSCGALLDFSLPEGTVHQNTVKETTYETETYGGWGHGGYDYYGGYGYQPVGYYDPWNPFVAAVGFGVLCAVIF
ncbi:MAG: hypothetical protein ACE366_08260 [Bradymonadia bacterium]